MAVLELHHYIPLSKKILIVEISSIGVKKYFENIE